MAQQQEQSLKTLVVRGATGYDPKTGAVSIPIYQSATFRHEAFGQTTGYDYSRLQNPTREEVEKTMALLEKGYDALAFSSGMAAISTIGKLFRTGDHLVLSDDLYGGTYRLFTEIYGRFGVTVTFVDTSDLTAVQAAIRPETKAIFVETPTNPTMKVTDIRGVAQLAKAFKVLLIVDNTFLTPYYQQPLTLGADLVVHSGTKYLAGHNDTLCGFVICKEPGLAEELRLIQKSEGAVLSPFDCWLVLRGLKTLAIRLDAQEKNALCIATWLKSHPHVTDVKYTGLPEHPGYGIMKEQSRGFGAMISFYTDTPERAKAVLGKLKLIYFAESLGGVDTLMTYPMVQTHAAIPEAIRQAIGVTDTLLRLSVGIEDVEELINDLAQALDDDNQVNL